MRALSTTFKAVFFGGAIATTMVVGYLDYATGDTIDFFLFYLLPVGTAAWYCGALPGVLISAACAVSWFISDLYTHSIGSDHAITIANTFIRLAVFLIITFSVWSIRLYREKTREFAEFIVHDLRSPLTAISMGLSSMSGACKTMSQDTLARTVAACKASADRMTELVNAILDLSRMESGKMKIDMDDVHPAEVADRVIEEASIYAERKKLRFRKDIDGGLTGVIRTDGKLLIRILVNLVSNAIKVSPEGSVIDLTIVPYGNEGIKFSVVDNGPGIPKDMLDKVFDKFFQLKSGGPKLMASSGLGLSFCKRAVEALGGRIWLESKIEKGTTVSFVLPVTWK